MKLFVIIVLALIVLTAGCGFTIHFGGEKFKNAIGGHMVLGIVSVISVIALVIYTFIKK